jgi:hypothetical protein
MDTTKLTPATGAQLDDADAAGSLYAITWHARWGAQGTYVTSSVELAHRWRAHHVLTDLVENIVWGYDVLYATLHHAGHGDPNGSGHTGLAAVDTDRDDTKAIAHDYREAVVAFAATRSVEFFDAMYAQYGNLPDFDDVQQVEILDEPHWP